MASKSSTKQDGEATTEEVPGSIVTYTEEEINTFNDDMSSEDTKKSTSTSVRAPLAIVVLRKVQNRAELEQHFYNRSSATSEAFFFFVEIRKTGKENKGKEYA